MNVLVSQCSYHHEKHNMYLRGLVLAALGLEVKRSKAMIATAPHLFGLKHVKVNISEIHYKKRSKSMDARRSRCA